MHGLTGNLPKYLSVLRVYKQEKPGLWSEAHDSEPVNQDLSYIVNYDLGEFRKSLP